MEAWAYPLKLVDDFKLGFLLEGYPLEIDGPQIARWIDVRPEATTFTYSHAGFTVRQMIFAPVDEPAIVMLLDVQSVLPLTVVGSFRPRLKLMWPAGLMTGDVGWDEKAQAYSITEESKRFAAVIGCPGARDVSLMPYQEEPRDVPVRFMVDVPPDRMRSHLVPIVLAGSVEGRAGAMATYERLLASATPLYEKNVAHYRALQERTVGISTPDPRVDTAFAWAKVGMDKGMADQPAARHGAPGRLPDLGGKRAARVRVDVRARRVVDRARHHVRRRLRRHAHGARLPAAVPARRRQDPPRDLPERVARAVVGPTTSSRGRPPTRPRCT